MPHRQGSRILLIGACAFGASITASACSKDKLEGPQAEVKKIDVKLELPPVPAFELPPQPGDGSHTVKELRVKGKKLFDAEVTVKGVITFVYDCPTAIRQPDESDADLQKRIDTDPTLCERPKFYVGDTAQTPAEKSLWVVDVPRPYNKLELERIKKQDRNDPLKCEPNEKDPKKQVCPPYKVGDEVTVTGKFALASPHSERNTDGLMIYKKMKNGTQSWESPAVDPAATGPAPTGPAPTGPQKPGPGGGGKPSPEDIVKGKKTHG
jgi:hypothetical protein